MFPSHLDKNPGMLRAFQGHYSGEHYTPPLGEIPLEELSGPESLATESNGLQPHSQYVALSGIPLVVRHAMQMVLPRGVQGGYFPAILLSIPILIPAPRHSGHS
jgi:hypothetical protein